MPYDKEKDKVIKEWRHRINSEKDLSISIRSYDSKAAKLQIGPYIRVNNDGNDIGVWGRLGRMDVTEAQLVLDYLPKAIKHMMKLEKEKKKV